MTHGNFFLARGLSSLVLSASFLLIAGGALLAQSTAQEGHGYAPQVTPASTSAPLVEPDCVHHPV